jgi:hypothetical protein
MNITHIDFSPSQQSCLNDVTGLIKTLAENGHFEKAHITLKGDTRWWVIVMGTQGPDLEWYQPASVALATEPSWNLKVTITVPTPVPLAVLLHLASASSADVLMPPLLIRDGWCRVPQSTNSLELSMTVRKSDAFGGFHG